METGVATDFVITTRPKMVLGQTPSAEEFRDLNGPKYGLAAQNSRMIQSRAITIRIFRA